MPQRNSRGTAEEIGGHVLAGVLGSCIGHALRIPAGSIAGAVLGVAIHAALDQPLASFLVALEN